MKLENKELLTTVIISFDWNLETTHFPKVKQIKSTDNFNFDHKLSENSLINV